MPNSREQILDAARADGQLQALRVLAVAAKSNATRDNAEREMTFPRPGRNDRPAATGSAGRDSDLRSQAGIKPVMITGDHPLTAQAVARELGLLQDGSRGHRRGTRSDER